MSQLAAELSQQAEREFAVQHSSARSLPAAVPSAAHEAPSSGTLALAGAPLWHSTPGFGLLSNLPLLCPMGHLECDGRDEVTLKGQLAQGSEQVTDVVEGRC